MLPTIRPASSAALQRDLLLWTTRDGREIPLDEMSDEHVANALRVLTAWRARLKKQDAESPQIRDLRDAIHRFKLLQRLRRKSQPKSRFRPRQGFGSRRRIAR